MERQLWKLIVVLLDGMSNTHGSVLYKHPDDSIVLVWFWAVVHDRPVSWACQRRNWPICEHHRALPSAPTMSRRLRTASIRALLARVEEKVLRPYEELVTVWAIDGKPLPISGCSTDRQAGFGRAACCKAKGYKLHAIVGSNGSIATWRVAPMNLDERVMAARMFKSSPCRGYVIADGNYDSNPLYEICDRDESLQLIARRRKPGTGLGNRKQAAGRLRSIEILEEPNNEFGQQLMHQREDIERFYGNLSNWGGGLTHLPPWVRTHRRVSRWVQAKLILNGLRNPPTEPPFLRTYDDG